MLLPWDPPYVRTMYLCIQLQVGTCTSTCGPGSLGSLCARLHLCDVSLVSTLSDVSRALPPAPTGMAMFQCQSQPFRRILASGCQAVWVSSTAADSCLPSRGNFGSVFLRLARRGSQLVCDPNRYPLAVTHET